VRVYNRAGGAPKSLLPPSAEKVIPREVTGEAHSLAAVRRTAGRVSPGVLRTAAKRFGCKFGWRSYKHWADCAARRPDDAGL